MLLFAASLASSLAPSRHSHALTFNFLPAPGMSQQAIDGLNVAGLRWSSLLADDVTVNLSIDFAPLPSGVLGSTSSSQMNYTYANARAALVADAGSADDATATGFLQSAAATSLYINYTSDSPHGVGSPTPYLDANASGNNSNVRLHHANAKALGLRGADHDAADGSITFNSSGFAWDFNPYDGVAGGAYDFVGIATHEIAHALGFSSGVDALDTNSPGSNGTFLAEDEVHTKAIDLFRYSIDSRAYGAGVFDMSADARAKFFSINGGTTSLGAFSTGRVKGDGQQAGHWKDNQNLGIMDLTIASGAQQFISALDRRVLDVIGWNPGSRWLWMDPAGGSFSSAIRWSSTAAPQAGQEAVFHLDNAYTVNFVSARTTAAAEVRGGNVTFNLGTTTYNAGSTLDVAPAAGQAATLNVTGGTLAASIVSIGGDSVGAGGIGTLSVNGGGGTLRYDGGVVTSPQIQLNGGTIHATNGVASGAPVTASGGTIRVDAGTHTLSGAVSITAATLIKTGAGTLVIAGAQSHAVGSVLHAAAGTTALETNAGSVAAPGTLAVLADSTLHFNATQSLASLTVGPGAAATIAAGGARSIKTAAVAVDVAGGGALDLKDNLLVLDYADGASAVAHVHHLLAAGYNEGAWNGAGIVTSSAGDAGLYTLGCAEAADVLGLEGMQTATWGGQIVDASAVLVRYSYGGDINFDGRITGDDYGTIDYAIITPGLSGYYNGDFNYDGKINGDDYGVIDYAIIAQGPPLLEAAPAAPAAPVTAVPEPASGLFAAVLTGAVTLTRAGRRAPDGWRRLGRS